MPKQLLVLAMQKLLIALLLLLAKSNHAQDCKTRAQNKPSESVRFQDDYSRSGEGPKVTVNVARLKPSLTAAENWVKGLLKGFTGAKLAYSNNFWFNLSDISYTGQFYKASGIKGAYSAHMRFYAYYCYDNNDKIFTEEESGSSVQVHFNNVFVDVLNNTAVMVTVNGKPCFEMLEKTKSEGRIDYYEQIAMSNAYDSIYKSKNEFIIIRNSDQPVFLAVTRKEYLGQLLKEVDVYKNREIGFAKTIYAADADGFKKRVAKIETDADQAKQVITEYLQKPQEWLGRSFKRFYNYSSYTAKGMRDYLEKLDVFSLSREEESRTYVASLNPAYYKSPDTELPQSIIVVLRKGSYPHMRKVSALIHQRGALKPLENLLNSGKKPVEQPLIVSTYKVSYLPKLDKVTPLVVPADMKPSVVPVNNAVPVKKINFELPLLSPKLKELPAQALTTEGYKNYVLDLHSKITAALKPEIKKKADDYLANKKLTQSKDISHAAFSAWLQNSPEASLYFYSKAVLNDPSDALTANNFAAFLMMGGLPEKSIPILEFWNKQKPGEPALLANLGNAWYRMGDMNNAMNYLRQTVQKDSLHPTANKLLSIMYLQKGDAKKAEEHATRSISASHDEQMISTIRHLNNKIKVGEVMSRFPSLPEKEFPLIRRIHLPAMPTSLDDMEQFTIELNALKESLKMTIADIEAKLQNVTGDIQQQSLMAGLSPMRIKAQHIIMDGMQIYKEESAKAADVFHYHVKKLAAKYNPTIQAIIKQYNDKLNKLEGGESGGEAEIQALELAKCREINTASEKHLGELAPLVNAYAQRQEFLSRKFYSNYAFYAPSWVPETTASFPSIERDFLKAIANILSEYKLISKSNCSVYEPAEAKRGELKEWEDEYCANFKGKIAIGAVKFFFTCNSWGIDGGEGFVGDVEFKYRDNGAFENFTVGLGIGANWHLRKEKIVNAEAGISLKDFIKIGPDAATGKWMIKDAGWKVEITGEASIGKVAVEEKVLEVSLAVNAGFEAGGIVPSIFNLK